MVSSSNFAFAHRIKFILNFCDSSERKCFSLKKFKHFFVFSLRDIFNFLVTVKARDKEILKREPVNTEDNRSSDNSD